MSTGVEEPRPPLKKRVLAAVVLLIAGVVLLKLLIGVFAALWGTAVIVVAVLAIVWAWRTL